MFVSERERERGGDPPEFIDLSDLSGLMIATKNGDSAAVANLIIR